jgi:hypothetical protein
MASAFFGRALSTTRRHACAAAAAAVLGGGAATCAASARAEENPFSAGSPMRRSPPPTGATPAAFDSPGAPPGHGWSWPDPRTFAFPAGERPACMFDGASFDGWEGKVGRYWEIENGGIRAFMNPADAPPVSTYLISTKATYRNFRLLFEMRMPTGNHSGVGFWGRRHSFEGEDFTWQGHLAILPQTGIFDIYRRGWKERCDREGTTHGISGDWLCKGPGTGGEGPKDVFSLHGWNQVEILCIGSRVRIAINGVCTSDWTVRPPSQLLQPPPQPPVP